MTKIFQNGAGVGGSPESWNPAEQRAKRGIVPYAEEARISSKNACIFSVFEFSSVNRSKSRFDRG
jgi:hypothetical protein